MTRQRERSGTFARSARGLVALVAGLTCIALLTPVANASPIGDADNAITAAWKEAGGDTSDLGAKQGDCYVAGQGFAQDFLHGKMFFTPASGPRSMMGAILDKYEALGGPAASDLGFPITSEVRGLAGPDSRVSTFSASDKPLIYWTADHGAFVVRGAINAAWDKLGSSGGALGVPIGDETYDGELATQAFSGGKVSWNRLTKAFTTVPPNLAGQLVGLQVPIDPTADINMAWRAAGGASGPLGAKQGDQYPVGSDGLAQNFAGGKIFFSPATGANAVETDILTKYEALGGPANSDLGFPISNEADGGVKPASKVSSFSANDKPVIFWTSDHGAFVVRGAIKAAWDKLLGASGKLGAPLGDQVIAKDVVTQKFTGGQIAWNKTKNTFTTQPPNLASALSGLQIPGQKTPAGSGIAQCWGQLADRALVVVAGRCCGAFAGGPAGAGGAVVASASCCETRSARRGQRLGRLRLRGRHRICLALVAGGRQRPGVVELVPGVSAASADRAIAQSALQCVDATGPQKFGRRAAGRGRNRQSRRVFRIRRLRSRPGRRSWPGVRARLPTSSSDADEHFDEDPDDVDTDPTGIPLAGGDARAGRHAAADGEDALVTEAVPIPRIASGQLAIHLPMDDPYQVPDGYPVKANASSGLYYMPDSALYEDTQAEIWFASEEVAKANGFHKAG